LNTGKEALPPVGEADVTRAFALTNEVVMVTPGGWSGWPSACSAFAGQFVLCWRLPAMI